MIKPYDVITGSSAGGWTDRDIVLALAGTLESINADDTASNGHIYDTEAAKMYKSLASDTDDSVDVEFYTDWFQDLVENNLLDSYCSMQWQDNEFICLPDVEACQYDMEGDNAVSDELPDDNSIQCAFLVINDHGNTTYYEREHGCALWREIWSVV